MPLAPGIVRAALAVVTALALGAMTLHADTPSATTKAINELLAASWKTNNLKASDKAGDQEFIRRVTLDLLGRVASVDEMRAFQKDTSADKRARLIDRLLASPEEGKKGEEKPADKKSAVMDEFAGHQARTWAVLLVGRSGTPEARVPLERWLEKQFSWNQGWDKIATGLITATGEPSAKGAAGYIHANLGEAFPEAKWPADGQFDQVGLTLKTLRLFLGYRLQNNPQHPAHPDWQLKHFWGINTFFRQVKRSPDGTITDDPELNVENYVVYESSEGKTYSAQSRFLDGRTLQDGKGVRRQQLADMIVRHDNFAKTYVNRVWGSLFGRGLNDQPQVDDFGSQNKVLHAELLDRLAKDFVASNYDTRQLYRAICNSDAYQLSSIANPSNAKREAAPYFSRMALKIMTPEQLFESLMIVTHARSFHECDELIKLRHDSVRSFTTAPGNYESDEIGFGDNLLPAITMINNRAINDLIFHKDGTVARAMARAKDNPEVIIEELYLTALNRTPNAKETERIQRIVNEAAPKKEEKGLTPLWQDLFWALLNSNEFILNH